MSLNYKTAPERNQGKKSSRVALSGGSPFFPSKPHLEIIDPASSFLPCP